MKRLKVPVVIGLSIVVAVLAVAILIALAPTEHPNIVLISIDTLRADYFTPEHMPLTYQWAKDNATIYTRCYSDSTWTLTSHVSMMTGLKPSEHGVLFWDQAMSRSTPKIASDLRGAGYHTAAFVAGGFVAAAFGFDDGFDEYHDTQTETPPPYEHSIPEASTWLQSAPQQPFFLFVHTYRIHDYHRDARKIEAVRVLPENLRALYEVAVAAFDSELADFMVPASSIPNTRIIVTSDHGESFGDESPDIWRHGQPPKYPSLTHIPLIVSGPPVAKPDALLTLSDIRSIVLGHKIAGRSEVASEYISYVHADDLFYTATIDSFGGHHIEVTRFQGVHSSQAQLPEDTQKKLRALGYLD